MGKAKKRCGDEEGFGGGNGDAQTECPLPKLVLKVGGKEKKPKIDVDMIPSEILRDLDDPVHSSHHKKKKKKHKHKSDNPALEKKNRNKRQNDSNNMTINSMSDTFGDTAPVKKVTRPPHKEEYKKPVLSPLALCLESLHRNLQRKDVYGIFSFPVTDAIAPGYSKIIKQPMDFLLMSKKISNNEYTSLDEFRNDFVVMCNNAMLYNGSDTIYYKSAEKMLSLGLKMLAKDKLFKLNKSIGVVVGASEDDEDDIVTVDEVEEVAPTVTSTTTPLMEGSVNEVKADSEHQPPRKRDQGGSSSLLDSVLASARSAREQLMKKHPDQMYGYLSRNQESGETSLNILNPDTCGTNKKVTVKISKKLEQGISPGDAVPKEDKKNKVIPVNYLMYGPYGSFGPAYDSSLSNMTKEESDMLLVSYGSELGVEYVRSLMNFTNNAPQVREYVDGVLNVLTHGKHGKTNLSANTRVNQTVQGGKETTGGKGIEEEVDIDSLLTLDGAGIDVTFLKDMLKPQEPKTAVNQYPSKISTSKPDKSLVTPSDEKMLKSEENIAKQSDNSSSRQKAVVSGKLLENAAMLESLKQCQEKRLGNRYGGTLPVPDEEVKTALNISGNICQLMKMVPPGGVVSEDGIRKAIGSGNSTMHVIDTERTQNNDINDTNKNLNSSNSICDVTTITTDNSNDFSNNSTNSSVSSTNSTNCSGPKTEANFSGTTATTSCNNESLQQRSGVLSGLPSANKTNGPFVIGDG